jgi:large subunit ribosomal protein L24
MNIRKGDTVYIISGKEVGKQGKIEKVLPIADRVVVGGINIRKHHQKPSQKFPQGGIVEFPAPMNRSNVMVVCPHCSKTTRVKSTTSEDGQKYRCCVHCQGSLDSSI